MIEAGAYPSPLNYFNFPKSVCTSVNEVTSSSSSSGLARQQARH
jgi:methionine aminopeptidase